MKKGGEVTCDYCASRFFLHEAYKGSTEKIRNFYELAYNAQESGNASEAYKYFTKILELDTHESLAWYGKGIATLELSTGFKVNSAEGTACFNKALEYAENDEKVKLRETISESSYFYATAIYSWLYQNGWVDRHNYSDLMDLFFYSDEMAGFNVGQMKYVVNIMCFYVYIDYTEMINYYTRRIKQTEKYYLNPRQRKTITTIVLILTPVLILILLFVFCCLCTGMGSVMGSA